LLRLPSGVAYGPSVEGAGWPVNVIEPGVTRIGLPTWIVI
jgi:hypothetical protein